MFVDLDPATDGIAHDWSKPLAHERRAIWAEAPDHALVTRNLRRYASGIHHSILGDADHLLPVVNAVGIRVIPSGQRRKFNHFVRLALPEEPLADLIKGEAAWK